MKDTKKYYDYIDKLINDTPDFMMINDDESYVLLDRLVVDLSENAMPWLFKVYLDQNYNILKEDNLTDYIKDKYKDIDLKVRNENGNVFLNKDVMYVILKELEENNQVVYENEIRRLMEEEAQEQVRKMEEFFNNKKENEGFDILSFELNENGEYVEKYIEVKSTKGNEGTPIDITSDEIDFAKKHIDNYYLYRIINSESKYRYLKIVRGKDLFNNTDYNFVPTSYKIYSN